MEWWYYVSRAGRLVVIGVGIATALAVTSCIGEEARSVGSDEPDAGVATEFDRRDSLGVEILEYTVLGSTPTVWVVGGSERVRFGKRGDVASDSALTLGQPLGAVGLDDGRVAVADRLASAVRVFRSDGTLERTLGGPGEGPGELQDVSGLYPHGSDSLAVPEWDFSLTVYSAADGGFRTSTLDPTVRGGAAYPRVLGIFADGSVLAQSIIESRSPDTPTGVNRGDVEFFRYSREGGLLSDFGTFPRAPLVLLSEAEAGEGLTVFRASPGPLVYLQDDQVYWGSPSLDEFRVFGPTGDLQRVVRFRLESTVPVETDFRFYEYVPESIPPGAQERLEVEYARIGPATFGGFVVDDLGYMWFREPRDERDDEGEPGTWWVFDASGELTAMIQLPYWWGMGGTELEIGADFILAFEIDGLDVASYVWVPLARRDGG